MYKLSKRSLDNLKCVEASLIIVVKRAIEITKVDFGVIEGVRTLTRQKELVKAGASQTMNSKHLDGRAVDVIAYNSYRPTWEITYYDEVAEAFAQAARELETPIKWGAAWHWQNIATYPKSMQELTEEYVDLRKSYGRKPFLDFPHFELA